MDAAVIDGAKTVFKFLFSRVKTLSNYEENVRDLREEIASLTTKKLAIEEDITLAKLEGRGARPQVIKWLKKVARAEDDVRRLLETVEAEAGTRGSKMMQSWTVARKLELVKELESVDFETVAREVGSPVKPVMEMTVPPLVGRGAAADMKRLWEMLNRDDIRRIAVWGKGGIGKTTLVKNLSNELYFSSPNSFDIVIWVEVSKTLDLSTIQSQIAKRINLKLEAGETGHSISSRILRRLKLRRKILLILDDVWEKIDLDAVGIPSTDPSFCKILLTTRSRNVCSRMEADFSFQLNLMSEEDAWILFVHSAGPVLDLTGIESPARKLVASFNGLPLAIKTLGNSMRDRPQIELWRNAYLKWRCSSPLFKNIEKEIFGTLATSYYSLPSKILKQCFLFCSLYPTSFSIDVDELIQCWISDGLITENQSMEDAYNYGVALVEHLKDSCLLDQDSEGTVKMHDILRDLAMFLSQSHELMFGFHTQSGLQLPQMPHECSIRASFMRCRIQNLPEFPVYSQLTVLFLQGNPIQKIPDQFFQNLISLKVLNLSDTQITSLPSSFHRLRELRSLFLKNCSIEKLPSVKSLCKLLILDLSGTRIKALPKGLGSLHSLRELYLSSTNFLNNIASGSLSGLSSLETLDMSFSAYSWGYSQNPKTGTDQRATLNELSSLERLSVLKLRLDSVKWLEPHSWLTKLKRFDIQITPWSHNATRHIPKHNEKRLLLRGVDLLQEDLQDLLHHTTVLHLLTCIGMTPKHWLSLTSLTSLTISNCNDITRLITKERKSKEMFPNLHHLVLNHLPNLTTIVEGILPRGRCLTNLTTIEVSNCPMIKQVVCYAMLRHVKRLEEIRVSGCENVRCVIESGEHEESLPELKVLEVSKMVKLRSICDGTKVCPVLQRIRVVECGGLKKIPVTVSGECGVKKIEGDVEWWNGLRWEDDESKRFFGQWFQAFPRENCSRKRKYK